MNPKYKLLTVKEVADMFFKNGYQFNRVLLFFFDTRKSATNKQLDNILDCWAVKIIQVNNTAIIVAMDIDGNNLAYEKIPWAKKYVIEFLDEYCKSQCNKYDGRIRVLYKDWLLTDIDYFMATYCDIE